MIDLDTLRRDLDAKIKAVHAANIASKATDSPCEHDWQTYMMRVHPYRAHDKQPPFLGKGAYFVTRGCTKCHVKRHIDYVVER